MNTTADDMGGPETGTNIPMSEVMGDASASSDNQDGDNFLEKGLKVTYSTPYYLLSLAGCKSHLSNVRNAGKMGSELYAHRG